MEPILLWPDHPERKSAIGRAAILPFLHEDTAKKRPAILVCPGGGYALVCHGYEGSDVAEVFRDLGYQAFVLDYRCNDVHEHYPVPLQDAARAVKLIRANADRLGVDPDRIASLGFSAGGHLAGCLGTSIIDEVDANNGDAADAFSARVNGMVLCYPVTCFDNTYGHPGSGENLLEEFTPANRANFDLATHIDRKTPPTFLFHTIADQCVPFRGVVRLADTLATAGIPAGLHLFPFGAHGAGLASDTIDTIQWPALADQFLRRAWTQEN